MTKKNIILTTLICLILIVTGVYLFKKPALKKEEVSKHNPCLAENEVADFDYAIDLYNSTGVKLPINATTTIYIKDKNTNIELFRFVVSNVPINSPSIEIHKCGVYVIRDIFSDVKKGIYKKPQFWRYTYDGKGAILMNEKNFDPYTPIPRIAPSENYLALGRYYLGHPEHAVVIKNLKTPKLDDVLVIKPDDIWESLPQLNKERNIGLVGWSNDSKYVWGSSQSQTDTVYFRVDVNKKDLKIDVFPMPDDAVHYGPPRLDTGYIWYIYGMPWVGFEEDAKRLAEEWRKEGKKEILFLYNLFTKEKITLATVDNPDWNFKPKWLSDTELEYELPTGEKKIYKINDR